MKVIMDLLCWDVGLIVHLFVVLLLKRPAYIHLFHIIADRTSPALVCSLIHDGSVLF